jgi:general secretion pathway protein D
MNRIFETETMKRLIHIALVLGIFTSGGCAVTQQVHDTIRGPVATSRSLVNNGKPAEAVDVLKAAKAQRPNDIDVNVALAKTQTNYVNDEVHTASLALVAGNDEQALTSLQNALKADPLNQKARQMVKQIQRRSQLRETLLQAAQMKDTHPAEALARVNGVLAEQPDFPEAIKLREQIARHTEKSAFLRPRLSENLRKPVSLNFRSQPLQNIFDVISRMSGVNFVFDKDVQLAQPASIFAQSTTAEDAINLLLRTNQLDKRVLDANTLMIYPARPDKDRTYKEFAIRTFFISHTDAKTVMAALRQMIKPKEVYVDERINAVIVRDTPATLEVADRIVRGLDIPQSEVTMDVQILEVNSNDQVDLGVDYPGKITGTLNAAAPVGHVFTVGDLLHFRGSDVGLQGDSGALKMALNILQKQGKTKTLANPKIRVRNMEKASINIGQQVPIVTTTNANGVVTESVAYQNVGLTLKVEPRISLDNEVGVKVNLEVSNILSKETTKTGLTAYTLGTRKAETLMSARDDETQVLAGLINRSESTLTSGLPYLSTIPGVGRLFGSNSKSDDGSEIVLLITPHIERNLELPAAATSTFMSGTEAEVTSDSLTLGEPAAASNAVSEGGPLMSDTISPAVQPRDAGVPADGMPAPDASAQAPQQEAAPASAAQSDTPRFGGATTGPQGASPSPQPEEGVNQLRGMSRGSAPQALESQPMTSESAHATVPVLASRGSEAVARNVVAVRAQPVRSSRMAQVSLSRRMASVMTSSHHRTVLARKAASSQQRIASAQARAKLRVASASASAVSAWRVVAARASFWSSPKPHRVFAAAHVGHPLRLAASSAPRRQIVAAHRNARRLIVVAHTLPSPRVMAAGVSRLLPQPLPLVSNSPARSSMRLVGQPWALPSIRLVSPLLRLENPRSPEVNAGCDGLA